MTFSRVLLALVFLFLSVTAGNAETLRLAVTTSFHNSSLSDVLLPQIEDDINLDIQLIVVGTGQALKLGRAGDVDAILVHSKSAEEEFVEQGYATHRREIMYNDFVFIGPTIDKADISNARSAIDALNRIASRKATFVSRGDDSGTHRREQNLWSSAGSNIELFDATWYREVGAGMGAALNAASAMNAYIISDRASWLNFQNKGELKLLYSGDPALYNQYAFLPVNPARHPHVKAELAVQLEDWLAGENGQKLIAEYSIEGEHLFTPNAKPK